MKEAAAALNSGESGAEAGPIRVLVADDHKIVRQGLVGILQIEPDIEVVGEASDGEEAVALARKLQPDVVIMDVTMPRMTGIEATKLIRREMPKTRVIGLSMHAESDMAKAMCAAGASAYLTKGGPSEDLIAAIRSAEGLTTFCACGSALPEDVRGFDRDRGAGETRDRARGVVRRGPRGRHARAIKAGARIGRRRFRRAASDAAPARRRWLPSA